jgi:hypothetical protein
MVGLVGQEGKAQYEHMLEEGKARSGRHRSGSAE